jgi:hypothetical protein
MMERGYLVPSTLPWKHTVAMWHVATRLLKQSSSSHWHEWSTYAVDTEVPRKKHAMKETGLVGGLKDRKPKFDPWITNDLLLLKMPNRILIQP